MANSGAEHCMIEDDRPIAFAEALKNSVTRNVIHDAVQLAASLNHSTMEQLGVHLIGMVLSFSAGAANAIAFAKFTLYVSHVSGSSTAIGLRMEEEQPGDVMTPMYLLFYFIAGAVLAGLVIPANTMRLGQAHYEVVLFTVAAMELVCWWHELRYPEMLAAAMGLQNAIITSWSGAVLRTTHMTGTATDLGSALGRIISRFCRRHCQLGDYSKEDWDQHMVDRKKVVLMICLLISFIIGGLAGAEAYRYYHPRLHSLLIPAGLTIMLGVAHMAYRFVNREEAAGEKVAEQIFARELSVGSGGAGPDPANDPEKMAQFEHFMEGPSGGNTKPERLEQFIRQISGSKESPSLDATVLAAQITPIPVRGARVGHRGSPVTSLRSMRLHFWSVHAKR